jgi:hypothetical protein
MSWVTNNINIGGTEALLTRGQARAGRNGFAQKVRLELHHTGAGQEQGRVIVGNERRARNNFVTFTLKKAQKCGTKFITGH